MVFPLFVMAMLWDRFRLGDRRFLQARPVRLSIAGRTLVTNSVNVAVAVGFTVMGAFVLYLANTEQMTGGAGFQVAVGRGLSRLFGQIETWTAPVPEPLLGLAVLGLAGVFIHAALHDRHRPVPDAAVPACHGEQPAAPPDQNTV
jgi:hypothetical protein